MHASLSIERLILLTAAGTLLVVTSLTAGAPPDHEEDSPCTYTFSKGSGAALISYCVNEHRNLTSFISPAGVEHIRHGSAFADGYVVCSAAGVHGHDYADLGESPWGATAVLSGPTSTGVSLARTTADGQIRVDHTFKVDSVEGDVGLMVRVINLSTQTLSNVQYKRLSEFDPAGNFGPFWTRSLDEVEALDTVSFRGISLNANSFGLSHSTAISISNAADCSIATQVSGGVGNATAQIRYDLGSIGSLKSKTVKLVYKRK